MLKVSITIHNLGMVKKVTYYLDRTVVFSFLKLRSFLRGIATIFGFILCRTYWMLSLNCKPLTEQSPTVTQRYAQCNYFLLIMIYTSCYSHEPIGFYSIPSVTRYSNTGPWKHSYFTHGSPRNTKYHPQCR